MAHTSLDAETLLASLVSLRRAARQAAEPARRDIETVISSLEEAVGPTLTRSQAARLLGVSHTAIKHWIDKGDIATTPTAEGRSEIPVGQVLDLLESVERDRAAKGSLALAHTIHRLRREGHDLDVDALLSARERARAHDHHAKPELRSLAYHRAIAGRLDDAMASEARRRLRRWQRQGHIHRNAARAWAGLLDSPLPAIRREISADNEQMRALRQSSPFAGALTEHERRRIIAGVEAAIA